MEFRPDRFPARAAHGPIRSVSFQKLVTIPRERSTLHGIRTLRSFSDPLKVPAAPKDTLPPSSVSSTATQTRAPRRSSSSSSQITKNSSRTPARKSSDSVPNRAPDHPTAIHSSECQGVGKPSQNGGLQETESENTSLGVDSSIPLLVEKSSESIVPDIPALPTCVLSASQSPSRTETCSAESNSGLTSSLSSTAAAEETPVPPLAVTSSAPVEEVQSFLLPPSSPKKSPSGSRVESVAVNSASSSTTDSLVLSSNDLDKISMAVLSSILNSSASVLENSLSNIKQNAERIVRSTGKRRGRPPIYNRGSSRGRRSLQHRNTEPTPRTMTQSQSTSSPSPRGRGQRDPSSVDDVGLLSLCEDRASSRDAAPRKRSSTQASVEAASSSISSTSIVLAESPTSPPRKRKKSLDETDSIPDVQLPLSPAVLATHSHEDLSLGEDSECVSSLIDNVSDPSPPCAPLGSVRSYLRTLDTVRPPVLPQRDDQHSDYTLSPMSSSSMLLDEMEKEIQTCYSSDHGIEPNHLEDPSTVVNNMADLFLTLAAPHSESSIQNLSEHEKNNSSSPNSNIGDLQLPSSTSNIPDFSFPVPESSDVALKLPAFQLMLPSDIDVQRHNSAVSSGIVTRPEFPSVGLPALPSGFKVPPQLQASAFPAFYAIDSSQLLANHFFPSSFADGTHQQQLNPNFNHFFAQYLFPLMQSFPSFPSVPVVQDPMHPSGVLVGNGINGSDPIPDVSDPSAVSPKSAHSLSSSESTSLSFPLETDRRRGRPQKSNPSSRKGGRNGHAQPHSPRSKHTAEEPPPLDPDFFYRSNDDSSMPRTRLGSTRQTRKTAKK